LRLRALNDFCPKSSASRPSPGRRKPCKSLRVKDLLQ
jgi:hypothetical protein